MLYIHMLQDLSIKAADIESVSILRGIKRKYTVPIDEKDVSTEFAEFFISNTDISTMSSSVSLFQQVMQQIVELSKTGNNDFELINLKRALDIVGEIPDALTKNIDYAQRIMEWQPMLISVFTAIINDIPTLSTPEQKAAYDKRISGIFERILRVNESFSFRFDDLIHEAHIKHMEDLVDGMKEGYFFHVKLEEHIKHKDFSSIRARIPADELEKVDSINKQLLAIQKSVIRAYDVNMRMVGLSIFLYTLIKWAQEQQVEN